MDEADLKVKKAIREFRDRLGVGGTEFAQMLGVSQPTVQRWLGEFTPAPGPDAVIALARLAMDNAEEDLAYRFREYLLQTLDGVGEVVSWPEPGKSRSRSSELIIPKSLRPVVEFVVEAFSEKGSPERELWKNTLRMMATEYFARQKSLVTR